MNRLDLSDERERLLGRCLRRQAEQIPDATFLASGDARWSFGQVNDLANAAARGFAGLGVAAGDTVAFLMETCPDWVWCTLGLCKLGAIWVPVNTDYKGHWLREALEDSRARVLVVDAEQLPKLEGMDALPFERLVVRGHPERAPALPARSIEELVAEAGPEPDDSGLHYGQTAAVMWTSGTTGRAKGVMQSHNVWIRGALSGGETAGVREGDVLYSCLPMYQSAAWVANVYRALLFGVPCAIDPRFSASEFWERTRHYGATMVFTLGAMHMFLWNAPERDDDARNPVRVASMIPMPADLIPKFKARFGIEEIPQGYGQSEVMSLVTRLRGKPYAPNSLGEPAAGIEVRVLDDDDREVGVGEVGEMCVRPLVPYAIFNGYFHDDAATVRAWRNLWYHTGDLGRRDENGELFFVDRKQDFIRFKGRNISSFAVEHAFGAHPAVAQCAAHGVTAEELAAEAELKVCAVLKPGAEASPEELARFVNDHAPYFFVPRYIELLDALPQTPTGRVQKFKLRERGVTPTTWDARAAGFEVRR